jgi:hypothetical protein
MYPLSVSRAKISPCFGLSCPEHPFLSHDLPLCSNYDDVYKQILSGVILSAIKRTALFVVALGEVLSLTDAFISLK